MPRVILSFKLPEERAEFELAAKADNLSGALDGFQNWLRSEIKYKEHSVADLEMLELVRDKFFEFMNERNVGSL